MKEKLLMLGIVIGTIVLFAFPALALFSLFNIKIDKNEDTNKVMTIDTVKNNKEISTNKKALINMDNVFTFQGELIDEEELPLGQVDEKIKTITGDKVKNDFKAHESEIAKGDLVFEIIDKNGHNLFFISYDELDLMINDKIEYQKQFVLDEDEKLLRYVYLELQ